MTDTKKGRRDAGIVLIAAFKMFKAVLLILAGVGAFSLLSPEVAAEVRDWLLQLTVGRGLRIVQTALTFLNLADPGKLQIVGLGAILYGLLFATEGVGLWLMKRWAEYLAVTTTSVLIPFEIYEVTKRLTIVRVGALVANIALVAYLIYRLRHPSESQQGKESAG